MARFESFDEQPLSDLNPEALDFRAASELFAPVRRLPRTAFRTLRMTTDFQGREVPTVGGYLLFATDRFQRFPDAWIQVGRFAGVDRAELADSAEIRSLLPRAVGEAIEFVQKHLTRAAVITSVHRVDRWTIPVVALREAIVNAIVHADYGQQGSRIRLGGVRRSRRDSESRLASVGADDRRHSAGSLQASQPRHWARLP